MTLNNCIRNLRSRVKKQRSIMFARQKALLAILEQCSEKVSLLSKRTPRSLAENTFCNTTPAME